MLAVNVIRHKFLKTRTQVSCYLRRSIAFRNKSDRPNPFLEADNSINFKDIENSTPKGFHIIYATPLLKVLRLSYITVPACWVGLALDTYTFFTNENYMKNMQELFTSFTYRDKIFHSIGIIIFILLLQTAQSRIVVGIFRRENEFQTLLYGFLGPLTKTYVSHGVQAMEPTKQVGVYNLKGKKVILFSNGFQNFKEFHSVVNLRSS